MPTSQNVLESVIAQFEIPAALDKAEGFGSGLINDTYLCEFNAGTETRKYILQRINASVFRNPVEVMENVVTVTEHMQARLRREGVSDPLSVTPALVRTRNGRSFFRDSTNGYWRMFHFIEEGDVFDTVMSLDHAREVGRGLGRFQTLVSDLDPAKLHDTLPGFHHTPKYLAEYDNALRLDIKGRAKDAAAETAFVSRRRALAPLLTDLMASGRLPLRVVHNDPKVNNVMIRRATHEALCMLDLDTVKSGLVHFDFGDCVRSAANPLGEDAVEPEKVRFDEGLFEAVAGGYLREATFLTAGEIEMLPPSIKVITFELGLRFLADHLRGDTYFRTNYPGHNLHRARVQFKLLESIEAAAERITSFILTNRARA